MQKSPWTPAHSLTSETVSLLVREQFPSLAPARVLARYEGWDNVAFEINEEWIFRIPKRTDGELPLERELALLSRLRNVLPVPVPAYQLIGRPGPSFPYVFAGYLRLNGTPAIDMSVDLADAIALAPALGSFLSSVHSFSAAEAHELGVPHAEMDPRVCARGCGQAEQLASVLGAELINRCGSLLEDHIRANRPSFGPPRLLHADFSAEHILLSSDGRQVVGVIDWTDAEIGDPAFDFGYLWVWRGEPLLTEVIRHYRGDMDPGFLDRVRLYGVCSAIADAYYGVTAGIDKNRRIGVAALERSFLRNS